MNGLDVTKIRKDLKLTQEEFGKLIGVDKRTIINYEQGKVIPKTKASLLEMMLANGLTNTTPVVHAKKEVVSVVNNSSLLDDIEVLKDHIKTLKEFIVEKTKVAEMYLAENNLLKERIRILELNIGA
jgi:DNA-binding XRE family transcriptional regulator